jgi:hypothetical protein
VSRLFAFLAALLLVPAASAIADDLLGAAAEVEQAIEERLRVVLAHRLEGSGALLEDDIAGLELQDEARREAGLAPTGLTDNVRYLAAGEAETRDAQRAALERLLDADPDPIVRRLAEHRLSADDAATAEQLLADDRHNRRAAVLNDAVRPLGLFSGAALAAALNPILLAGSAADSLVTTAVNLWNYNRLSTPEREALARYQMLLEREPDTGDAPEIARAIKKIGAKRAAALCEESIEKAKKMLEHDDLDRAAFYVRAAKSLDGCDERAEDVDEKVKDALARHLASEEAGRWPVDDPPRPAPGGETVDYEALATATVLAEPGGMVEAASRFRERHPDSDFEPSARYVVAVARDLAGHREEARAAFAELADDDSSIGRHAEAVLASADYSGLDALAAAERRHARDTVRFVLLGGRWDGRTALYSATQLGAEGMRAAQSLGIFNVIGVASRAWQAWRKDPISNQVIIDRGEELLARDPSAADAAAVHGRLADAYERSGSYGRALMHLRAVPEPDQKRITKLEGKLADSLLESAARDGNDPLMLEGIVRHFAATDAAEKARKRLAERPGDDQTVLDRDVLRANPSLLASDALDIDPRLLDGERANGELADGGVTLAQGELRMKLENADGDGPRVETRPLAPEVYARARGAAREALYARLLTQDHRDPETGRFERYIPFYVRGALDEDGGVSVAPGVKLRRYRSEDRQLYE